MQRHVAVLVLVAAVAGVTAFAARAAVTLPAPTKLTDPVALVDGQPVTLGDLTVRTAQLLGGKPLVRPYPHSVGTLEEDAQDVALVTLLGFQAMASLAEQRGIKVTTADIDAAVTAGLGEKPKLNIAAYARLGIQAATVRSFYRRIALLSKLERAVRASAAPTPAEVRAFYDKNPQLFRASGPRQIAVILVKTKAQALDIVKRLAAGQDFTRLADTYSQDFSTKFDGGKTFANSGTTATPVDKVGLKLRTGAVSAPVATVDGWWVVKALTDAATDAVKPFAAVREEATKLATATAPEDAVNATWRRTTSAAAKNVVYASGYKPFAARFG